MTIKTSPKLLYIAWNSLFTILFFILYAKCDLNNVSQIAIIGMFQYLWMFTSWYLITREIINVYLIFLLLTFFFYLGQPILEVLNLKINAVMTINNSPFNIYNINLTLIFLMKSMALFHLGATFSIKKIKLNSIAIVQSKNIVLAGIVLFIISVIPQLNFMVASIKLMLTVGYAGIFQNSYMTGTGLDGGIPRFLSGFFKSALLLLIIGNVDNIKRLKFWIGISVLFSLLLILSGQRGSNTLFILGLILIYHYAVKPFTTKQILKVLSLAILGIIALSIISSLRNVGVSNYSFNQLLNLSEQNYFTSIIGEMGFTLIACTTVMFYSPITIPFNEGATYFNSLFSLIPNFFWDVNPSALGGVDQVFKSFLFQESGIGSSFIIEAYYNFGQYGLLLMPFFGFLLGRLYFSMVQAGKNKDYLTLYMCVYLAIIVLWFVRSETITFWRHFAYYALLPVVIIKLMTLLSKKIKYLNYKLNLRNSKSIEK